MGQKVLSALYKIFVFLLFPFLFGYPILVMSLSGALIGFFATLSFYGGAGSQQILAYMGLLGYIVGLISLLPIFLLFKLLKIQRKSIRTAILIVLIVIAWILMPQVVKKGVTKEVTNFQQNSNDAVTLTNAEQTSQILKKEYQKSGYYPMDLKTTFKCDQPDSEYSSQNILDRVSPCKVAKEPEVYQYMPLDCDSSNNCKGFRLIVVVGNDKTYYSRAQESQKECNFGTGNQYVFCAK